MTLLKSIVEYKVVVTFIAGVFSCWSAPALALEQNDHTHHGQHHGGGHAQHAQMLKQQGYARKEQVYQVPEVTLTDQGGRKVSLHDVLGSQEPVMLNFIFTTCTTICPVLSASFSQAQKRLGTDTKNIRMVSITIDPEYDTPVRLREYAQRYQAREGWMFLTGERGDIVAVLRAFDAYRRDKMNHIPLTFLRASPEASWLRLEGFASANEIASEYRALTSLGAGETD